eukprot:scaffold24928_cov17-Prasinocladus_malaysianus.AAC.1
MAKRKKKVVRSLFGAEVLTTKGPQTCRIPFGAGLHSTFHPKPFPLYTLDIAKRFLYTLDLVDNLRFNDDLIKDR